MGRILSVLEYFVTHPILFLYQILQYVLTKLLSPAPPPPRANLVRPKIAVIGAGLTGVSAASHIVGHGFDCRIFEAGPKENLGGIWSRVNNTSGLQIHSSMYLCTGTCETRVNSTSVMYRFHPAVHWKKGYPDRQQIVSQIKSLWEQYGLEDKTEFNTKVERVYKDPDGRWIINDPSHGRFDGVIAAIGTCGDPKMYVKSRNALHTKHTTDCIHHYQAYTTWTGKLQRRDLAQLPTRWQECQRQESCHYRRRRVSRRSTRIRCVFRSRTHQRPRSLREMDHSPKPSYRRTPSPQHLRFRNHLLLDPREYTASLLLPGLVRHLAPKQVQQRHLRRNTHGQRPNPRPHSNRQSILAPRRHPRLRRLRLRHQIQQALAWRPQERPWIRKTHRSRCCHHGHRLQAALAQFPAPRSLPGTVRAAKLVSASFPA
jgi:hypothetical protein